MGLGHDRLLPLDLLEIKVRQGIVGFVVDCSFEIYLRNDQIALSKNKILLRSCKNGQTQESNQTNNQVKSTGNEYIHDKSLQAPSIRS